MRGHISAFTKRVLIFSLIFILSLFINASGIANENVSKLCQQNWQLASKGLSPVVVVNVGGTKTDGSTYSFCKSVLELIDSVQAQYIELESTGKQRVQDIEAYIVENPEATDFDLLKHSRDIAAQGAEAEQAKASLLASQVRRLEMKKVNLDKITEFLESLRTVKRPLDSYHFQRSIMELKKLGSQIDTIKERSKDLIAVLGVSSEELQRVAIEAHEYSKRTNDNNSEDINEQILGPIEASLDTSEDADRLRASIAAVKSGVEFDADVVGDFASEHAMKTDIDEPFKSDYWHPGKKTFTKEYEYTGPARGGTNMGMTVADGETRVESTPQKDTNFKFDPKMGALGAIGAGAVVLAMTSLSSENSEKKSSGSKIAESPNNAAIASTGGSNSANTNAATNLCFHHYNNSAWKDKGLALIMCESTPSIDSCSIHDQSGKKLADLDKHGNLDKNREVFALYRTLGSEFPIPLEIRCRVSGSSTIGKINIANGDKYQNGPGA